MVYTQIMYRNRPNKQDHGTRGNGRRKGWSYSRYYYKAIKAGWSEQRKLNRRIQKVELNKLFIGCSDEDIERYLIRGNPAPVGDWYWYD